MLTTPQPKVSVILVNWNNHIDTLNCIRSVGQSTYPYRDVIVVDNGSSPESVAALRGAAGCDILIEADRNLGFTGGNNLGIHAALERGADLLFILNNDTVVDPRTIGLLVDALTATPTAGIAAPKIRFMEPADLLWYGGAQLSKLTLNLTMTGYKQIDDGRWDEPKDVDMVSGCAMLIRAELMERLGGFCDRYFAVFEDLDLSLRVKRAGYRLVYVPAAVVWHKESSSTGGHDSPAYVYYQVRNRFLFIRRWAHSRNARLAAYSFSVLHLAKRSAGFAVQGKWRSIAAVAGGTRDGVMGRGGARCGARRDTSPRNS